MRNTAKQKLFS